ncbi:MAG TPA: DASS family sodium-coupled anion symporter [Pyrinomonadaceae bacterium]|nr:DASS family sodium-coupled anion symporter [Pyrinomonadaceae bacterium]
MEKPSSLPADKTVANEPADTIGFRSRLIRWGIVLLVAAVIILIPVPSGITRQSWILLAIFAATITGSIVRPIPGAAMVLLGVTALPLFRVMTINEALTGYADPVVWLVLAAFFISRGMIKTGLGRRIAFLFIRAIGKHSLGLAYSLGFTEAILATVIPSTGARSGGIIFPIAKSLAEAYESRPGPTARRLGSFLMTSVYQCNVIVCAMFLTGQASNPIIARFAKEVTGIEITYARWAIGAIVPGVLSLLVVPWILYRVFPPEVKHTPAASELASTELKGMGPMKWSEWLMLLVFFLVAILWMTTKLHGIDYAVVALLGIGVLLVTGVLDWDDLVSEKAAWGVFIWYGGLIRMAEALGQTGITKRFAESSASLTTGWKWWLALASLLLIYFYAHYVFASITAHVTAMFTPFLIVILAAGAPPYLAVLSLAYFSNLAAALTHYGTTPAPIYFGAGYTTQRTWWTVGLITSLITILIWSVVGSTWWKVLRLW